MTQTETAIAAQNALRDFVLSNPAAVLEDPELMAALITADDARRGGNVVDLRGVAIARLEERLDKLESTHQDVLSAAYDNVATTRQVHRAIHAMIVPLDLEPFLRCMATDVADILRVSSVRVMLEPGTPADLPKVADNYGVIAPVAAGEVNTYLNTWQSGRSPDVVLRRTLRDLPKIHHQGHGPIRTEALVRLELGAAFPAALLALGATDAQQYLPSHATDLFELFGRVFERSLRSLLV